MKKFLLIILLFSLTGCSQSVDILGGKKVKEKPVKVKKLKASKDKILKAETVNECIEWNDELKMDCKKTKKVKQYHYISDVKVGKQTYKYKANKNSKEEIILTEDLSKVFAPISIYSGAVNSFLKALSSPLFFNIFSASFMIL